MNINNNLEDIQNIILDTSLELLSQICVYVYLKNLQGQYIWLSNSLLQLYDYSILEQKDENLPWSESKEMILASDHDTIKSDGINTVSMYEFFLNKQSLITVKYPWKYNGELLGILGLAYSYLNKETDANDTLKSFSHDLRLPINSLLGNIQLCRFLMQKGDIEQAFVMIERANRSIMAMVNTLDQLKFIQNTKNQSFFVFQTIQYEVDMANSLITPQQDLNIYYNIEPNVPREITTQLYKFSQILRNILSNAVKFTRAGNIHLNFRCSQQKVVETNYNNTSFQHKPKSLLITIKDTGYGIPQDIQDKMHKLKACSIKDINNNSGIEIVYKHIKEMGGNIEFHTSPNGTTFEITIPLITH